MGSALAHIRQRWVNIVAVREWERVVPSKSKKSAYYFAAAVSGQPLSAGLA